MGGVGDEVGRGTREIILKLHRTTHTLSFLRPTSLFGVDFGGAVDGDYEDQTPPFTQTHMLYLYSWSHSKKQGE